MTVANRSPKRENLLQAARSLLHRQGLRATTLADVAVESGVPLGNMYYYFKTKESLAAAVIESRLGEMEESLTAAGQSSDPRARLENYLQAMLPLADQLARYGCPYGCLAQELVRMGGAIGRKGASLLEKQRDWLTAQFAAMGAGRRQAGELGLELQASMHGAIVLGLGLGDPEVIRVRLKALMTWIDGLDVREVGLAR